MVMTGWEFENVNHYMVKPLWFWSISEFKKKFLSEACKMHVVNEVVGIDFFFDKQNLKKCFRKGRVWEGKTVFNHAKIAGLLLQEKDKTKAD